MSLTAIENQLPAEPISRGIVIALPFIRIHPESLSQKGMGNSDAPCRAMPSISGRKPKPMILFKHRLK